MFVDWVVFLLVMVGALFIAVAVESDRFSRQLGFAVAGLLLLYEPVLVWLTGSSVGHYLTNLRVVDHRTGGNVSFLKALARFVIKTLLGWYSLITMATTRRHQAVHDLLTGSTVQIRDTAKARSSHHAPERIELSNPGMPSRARRTMIILTYLLLLFAAALVAFYGLLVSSLLSPICSVQNRCSSGENLLSNLVILIWLACCGLVIVQGWRGRLPGCRAKRVGSAM